MVNALVQVLSMVTALVVPFRQTRDTVLPVRPWPLGLKMARSVAASPFPLASMPDITVTGCPAWNRYEPLYSQPCSSARPKAESTLSLGTSYTQVIAVLWRTSRAERPHSDFMLRKSSGRRGLTCEVNRSLVPLSWLLEKV